jgi:hypothetical protein
MNSPVWAIWAELAVRKTILRVVFSTFCGQKNLEKNSLKIL